MAERHPVDRRAMAMAERLASTARRRGIDPATADGLSERFLRVVAGRGIEDPEHPSYLHPARNALILLDDLGVTDAVELSAAIGFDGNRAPDAGNVDDEVTALLTAVPRCPVADGLLEELLSAPEAACRIALADRLDQARHLHLAVRDGWEAFHSETRDVWLPVAERTHPVLGRRFRWWTSMFDRRWLHGGRA